MLLNYFKIAWRNIIRNKTYTAINILGLAFGICTCITIYLITSYELNFDKFHPDRERIFRIVGEMQRASGEKEFLNCPVLHPAELEGSIPGFESSAGLHTFGEKITVPDDKKTKVFENKIDLSYQSTAIITWPSYFDIFKYQWLIGNQQSLSEPFKVVLTESRARKYFGNIPLDQVIGKTIIYADSLPVHVSGIVKDWDQNTDLGYTDFISIGTAVHSFLKNQIPTDDWSSIRPHNGNVWVKLANEASVTKVNKQLEAFVHKYAKEMPPGTKYALYLQPLSEIHFTSEFHRGDDGDDFRKPYLPTLYVLMGVALFILIIAVVNFINLSTAQSIQRAKEIGVRKVLGSNRANIIFQFLSETFVLVVASVAVAVMIVRPVMYLFKDYIPPGLDFHIFHPSTILFLFIIVFSTTLLAGSYPAKVLASYIPVLSLKGSAIQSGNNKMNLRKVLIVFQFSISLIFIIGAIGIGKQIHYMDKTDKGFNPNAIIVINHWRDQNGALRVFAENIKHIRGVHDVILQSNAPMGFAQGGDRFKYKSKDLTDQTVIFDGADENFIPFYQIKIIAGKNIGHSDSLRDLVINETYSKMLGFKVPGEAVGKFLYKNEVPYPVVGVVADFHQGSFHEPIHPAVIGRSPGREWSVSIKLDGAGKESGDIKIIMQEIEKQWKLLYADEPLRYNFLNESIAWLYGQEENTAWLVKVAMSITIFISCMGIFGLGMFTAQKRTKEIGIRKVLGATVTNIALMLGRDFAILVLIAIIIATPVAYYLMHQWLQDFTYRTSLSWWIFAFAGLVAIIIALLTVSYQAIRAAIANPIKSLRTE